MEELRFATMNGLCKTLTGSSLLGVIVVVHVTVYLLLSAECPLMEFVFVYVWGKLVYAWVFSTFIFDTYSVIYFLQIAIPAT